MMIKILEEVAYKRLLQNKDEFTIQLSAFLMKKAIEDVNKYAGKELIKEEEFSNEFQYVLHGKVFTIRNRAFRDDTNDEDVEESLSQSALTNNNKQVVSDEEIEKLAEVALPMGEYNNFGDPSEKEQERALWIEGFKSALNTYSADGLSEENAKVFAEWISGKYQMFFDKWIVMKGNGKFEDPYTTEQPFIEFSEVFKTYQNRNIFEKTMPVITCKPINADGLKS